ncbi:hypothetical protein C7974DRAFT_322238, partial [Boeremia exigua]|uniref:uncharacterized protein n=1 Tax=Boeremia exigua TaxID=749465 RepID=UPI001E8D0F18
LIRPQALARIRKQQKRTLRVFERYSNVVFLGTLQHGSGLAQWAESLAKAMSVLEQTNADILVVLKSDSEVLERTQGCFHTMIRAGNHDGLALIEITCFYEELPLPGVQTVISSAHSVTLRDYFPIAARQNHADMTNFRAVDDSGFVPVTGKVRRWVEVLVVAADDIRSTREIA